LPQLFNKINLTQNLLNQHPDYFNISRTKFENLTYWDNVSLYNKFKLDKELAFKSNKIDSFIEEFSNDLEVVSKLCKHLNFESLNRPTYYLVEIVENFVNLRILSFSWSDLNLSQFNLILDKLKKLEVLNLIYVNFIVTTHQCNFNLNNLLFPQSLQELNYVSVKFVNSELPKIAPLSYICNERSGYEKVDFDLFPQYLPNLKSLVYFNTNNDNDILAKFLKLNPQIKYFSENYS
jgi:hypothetical protein